MENNGYKHTKSRTAVVGVLESAEIPLTAEEIFLKIKEKGYTTNLSTVYRILEMLEEKGMLEKSVLSGNKGRYQLLCNGHRHHIVCTGCHKIIPINGCPLEQLEKKIGEKTNFDITGHKLELYGLCPDCRKE